MIQQKVFDIIADHFDMDKASLSLDTNLVENIHADSLDLVELIMAFEDGFSITIPDEVALSVKTIGDIVRYIENNQ